MTADRDDALLHPDEWLPGLSFDRDTLSRKSVSRAKDAEDVLRVALQHNLRIGNDRHRHRKPIDSARTSKNGVMIGADTPDGVVDEARAILARCGLEWPEDRRNRVVALEMIFQPPPGADVSEFWCEVVAWLERRFDHVLSLTIHRDQVRVHGHAIVMAIRNGAWDGREMGRNQFGRPKLRHSFLNHIRDSIGLRADRPGRTLADIAALCGSGAQTPAAAARRDAAFLAQTTPVGDWGREAMSIPTPREVFAGHCPELRRSAASAPEPATSLNPGAVGRVPADAVAGAPCGAAGAAAAQPDVGQARVSVESAPAQDAGGRDMAARHQDALADADAAAMRRAAALESARAAIRAALAAGVGADELADALVPAEVTDRDACEVLRGVSTRPGAMDAIALAARHRPRVVLTALHLVGVPVLH